MLKSESGTLPAAHTSTSRLKQKWVSPIQMAWEYRASYVFIAPFMVCFIIFIMIPVLAAFGLSFTYYNSLEPPRFVGWENFRYMLSQDLILIKYAIPNTFKFASIVGPGGISHPSCLRGLSLYCREFTVSGLLSHCTPRPWLAGLQ